MGNEDYDWLNPVADLADDFDSSDKFQEGIFKKLALSYACLHDTHACRSAHFVSED